MKKIILTIALMLGLAFVPAGIASAACNPNVGGGATNAATKQVLTGVGDAGGDCDGKGVENIATTAVRILSYVAGTVAVIMIIYAGFKYITSAGDSGKVASAKSAIIYAIVGIAIAALAQIIVNFVVSQSDLSANQCQWNANIKADHRNCREP